MLVVAGVLVGKSSIKNKVQEFLRLSFFLLSCDSCAYEVKIETPTVQVTGYVRQKYKNLKIRLDFI